MICRRRFLHSSKIKFFDMAATGLDNELFAPEKFFFASGDDGRLATERECSQSRPQRERSAVI
jgi:hypothetical protein